MRLKLIALAILVTSTTSVLSAASLEEKVNDIEKRLVAIERKIQQPSLKVSKTGIVPDNVLKFSITDDCEILQKELDDDKRAESTFNTVFWGPVAGTVKKVIKCSKTSFLLVENNDFDPAPNKMNLKFLQIKEKDFLYY